MPAPTQSDPVTIERRKGATAARCAPGPAAPRQRRALVRRGHSGHRGQPARRLALAIALTLLLQTAAVAQQREASGSLSLFRDPEDGAFDIGAWAATRTGVIPVVAPITEPAVGFGGTLALVLIHGGGLAGMESAPRGVTGKPVPPDISAVGGALTENETWAAFAAHVGFWGGDRWRYTGAVSRLSPRLDAYTSNGDSYAFNLDGWALVQEVRRRVAQTDLFVGMRALYVESTTRFDADILPPELTPDGHETRESALGAVGEYDTRDNIFTPNQGEQIKASAMFFDESLGSDREFQRYTADGLLFRNPRRRLVLSGRLRTQTVRGNEPFYARPFVRLRGIPAMRYQGETAVSLDAEARWALTARWWLVGFGGFGWTDAGSVRVLEDESVVAGGVGFRYLIARLLGLHMGLDVAKGPEEWATYVVFGSSW